MHTEPPAAYRQLRTEQITADLVIVGGGMSGVCCAITAARAGVRVALVQDRPVLGGNASSEVRLWILGATAHMGNNNRWAREGGVIDELLVENTYRNPEGNPLIFDSILLEKVVAEPNIRLLLNTAVFDVGKTHPDRIDSARAFCSQNSVMYELRAPLFCDASGDGVVGFLAGAAFRMGAEAASEFGEGLAPSQEYGELLGHSLYFYSKDTGKPVRFIPPSFALGDISEIPRFRSFNTKEDGCRLWWIEYGGRMDTVHDTEAIKWELWRVVYGVWNYIKNSGQFPDAETLTLEWVGHIPGKRESRRFEGEYMLQQRDVVEQRTHADAVSYGGWALDLHPADGIFSEKPGCNQWHSRGMYQIPYRTMYSRNISNLFLAGRIISATHVAFSSSRVQATLAHAAQVVGLAAAHCVGENLQPAALLEPSRMRRLQHALLRSGQFIPGVWLNDAHDLVRRARISASSSMQLAQLPANGPRVSLTTSWAQMLPVAAGPVPRLHLLLDVAEATTLHVELRTSDRPDNHTPDVTLGCRTFELSAGEHQAVDMDFDATVEQARYVFICLMANPKIHVYTTTTRITGLLSVTNATNPAVSNYGAQTASPDLGVESFQFWIPQRRPSGHNLAMQINPPLDTFAPANVGNGWGRPTNAPNAWVADSHDPEPTLTLQWATPQTIARIELGFDPDYDHPMESVLMTHPETAMPFCVKRYQIEDGEGRIVAAHNQNYQAHNLYVFDPPLHTNLLRVRLLETHGAPPPALFAVRCYATPT